MEKSASSSLSQRSGGTAVAAAPPKHILVVDDERVVLDLFETLFAGDPYRLTCIEDGREALDIIKNVGADLVIVDKNLRDISGLEVLKVTKELSPLTEVIVITGSISLDSVLMAIELDAFDYILKPINNIYDIKAKVRKALQKQQIVIENQRLVKHLSEYSQQLERALEERKRMESELIQSEKLAGIGTLAAGIAHEISSPLFGILGLAEAIGDEDQVSLCHEYAREIVEYSKQIREIVQDLSAYSRTSRHEERVPVDIRRTCEDAIRLVFRSRKMDGLEVVVSVEDDVTMRARPNELQQLLVNLIKNAVDAFESMGPGSSGLADATAEGSGTSQRRRRIEVKAWQTADTLHLQVGDNGCGIPPQALEKVFEPFYTTKSVGKGTGLGLHIVWRLVTKYGGSISVDSKAGIGTTFSMRFPIEDAG